MILVIIMLHTKIILVIIMLHTFVLLYRTWYTEDADYDRIYI
jgi:hypothetical protein